MSGRTILVVEDEQLVAMLIEDALVDAGAIVMGAAATVAEALMLLGTSVPDVAVMDMNLCGQSAAPVADALAARGVPFLVATGYGAAGLPKGHESAPVLAKPFDPNDLIRQLVALAARPPAA
nr:response regulator [Plastoroseomonas arctica]